VISVDLARRLFAAGLDWRPAAGDRFMVPGRDMDEMVFVISDMTVEVHDYPTGRTIGFNGTTEWALDSIEQHEVLWLPREEQLRTALGDRFVRLESMTGGFCVVMLDGDGAESRHVDGDAECAYARALEAALSA
jgi:hypothetical protein